jgi:hypothetical protein
LKRVYNFIRGIYKKILPKSVRQKIWPVKTFIAAKIRVIFEYIYEMLTFLFIRNAVRVSFVNFWILLEKDNWFLPPIKSYLKAHGKSCKTVKHFKADIQFFSVYGSIDKLIRSKTKYKIFFTSENINENTVLEGCKQYERNCIDHVDLSMGYDYIDNKNYIRLPFWLLGFFTPLDTKDIIRKKLTEFNIVYKKTKFCALLARHDQLYNMRTDIFNLASKIGRVDCPSMLLHNDESLHTEFNDNKYLYLRQYYFNICPENSNSPGYVTEKLFEALYSGCIPVYNGGGGGREGGGPEPGIINPGCFLWFEPGAENGDLITEMRKLYTNEEYYASFKKRPVFLDTAVDKIYYMLQQYAVRIAKITESLIQMREESCVKR